MNITEGVSGSVLTVSSLKRSEDSGNYTCMVTNKAGSVTIATYLNILGGSKLTYSVKLYNNFMSFASFVFGVKCKRVIRM